MPLTVGQGGGVGRCYAALQYTQGQISSCIHFCGAGHPESKIIGKPNQKCITGTVH